MKKLQLSLCAVGAYLVLVVAFGVFGARPATGQKGSPSGPDVRVVNTAANPVPVALQGTAQIAGSVNVVNTPTVKVDTTDALPVQDLYAARNAVQGALTQSIDYDVPAGKRLVIQFISIEAAGAAAGSDPVVYLRTSLNGNSISHRLPVVFSTSSAGSSFWKAAHEVTFYCDDVVETLTVQQGAHVDVTFHGYLVDMP